MGPGTMAAITAISLIADLIRDAQANGNDVDPAELAQAIAVAQSSRSAGLADLRRAIAEARGQG